MIALRRRVRFCATYVTLPFSLSPTVNTFGVLVVPPQAGGFDAGRAPVTVRFHQAPAPTLSLNTSGIEIAVAASRRPEAAWRHLEPDVAVLRSPAAATPPLRLRVAELVTEVPRGPINQQVSTGLFEYCLRALNRFLDVYVVATEDQSVHTLTAEHVGPEVVIGLRNRRLGRNLDLLLPNKAAQLRGDEAPGDDHLLPLLPQMLAAEPHEHPMDLVRRLKLRADRLADQGEHDSAVIVLQSSAERQVYALHRLARVDRGLHQSEADEMAQAPFKKALIGLNQELGGDWSLRGNGVVATYWRNLYELRGRLVHAGRSVDRDSVADAFDAYETFRSFCMQRVLDRRRRLPRTALALYGGIGLKEAGCLDAHMRRVIEQIQSAGEEHNFWLPADERK